MKLLSILLYPSLCFISLHGTLVNGETKTVFKVLPLPYGYNGLEPHLSNTTMRVQHDKTYRKHIMTMNAMIQTIDRLEESSIEEIMFDSHQWNRPLFHNAAQSWNLEFFFKCMTSKYHPPSPSLTKRLSKDFTSVEEFKIQFFKTGMSIFGSGWVWLVYNSSTNKLFIASTSGADNPLMENENYTPILALDVWEHAYFMDYHHRRDAYINVFLETLVDWRFVEENLVKAKKLKRLKDGKE